MRKEKALNPSRRFGLPRIALAAATLLACGPASAALLAIGPGSTFTTVGLSGGALHTDDDTISGRSSATQLFVITNDAAGSIPMSLASSKSGGGTANRDGASGGKSIAYAYLSCLTSKSCASTTPSVRVPFAPEDGGGSSGDNDFDDDVGYIGATPLAKPIAPSAIPAVPLPAAFWLLGSALLGIVGIRRRRVA